MGKGSDFDISIMTNPLTLAETDARATAGENIGKEVRGTHKGTLEAVEVEAAPKEISRQPTRGWD